MTLYGNMQNCYLKRILIAKHRKELTPTNSRPGHSVSYRTGPRYRAAERLEVDKVFMEGVAEPTMSEWASPVLYVLEQNESLQLCVYYRWLHATNVRNSYTVPVMNKSEDPLDAAQIFPPPGTSSLQLRI